jgi:MFS family permease
VPDPPEGTSRARGPRDPGASHAGTLGAGLAATTVGVLPAYVVGGLAVQLRADLDFGEGRLGLAVAVFFAASALGSAPFGRLVERIGAYRGTVAGTVAAAASMLGIALLARSWWSLAAWLAVAGMANAIVQVGVNLQLARRITPDRLGLAFGLKLSAVPASTLLAGVAVPLLALTVGWRYAFGVGALLAVAATATLPRTTPAPPRRGGRPVARTGDARVDALLVVAVAGGLGTAAANSLGAFVVDSSVLAGVDPAMGGWLLAGGSVLGIAVRVTAGMVADRVERPVLPAVAGLLALGAVGLWLLGEAGTDWRLPVAVALAFGAGWGWNGLYNLAVVRHNANAPAAATGITQAGVYLGGVVGPPIFGAIAEASGYPHAWRAAAVAVLASALLHLVGGRLLGRGRAPAA